jgi:hypothetical protein
MNQLPLPERADDDLEALMERHGDEFDLTGVSGGDPVSSGEPSAHGPDSCASTAMPPQGCQQVPGHPTAGDRLVPGA